jgi:hypothetical protein
VRRFLLLLSLLLLLLPLLLLELFYKDLSGWIQLCYNLLKG